MTSLAFHAFVRAEAPERYDAYRRIVRRVFVEELAWPLPDGSEPDLVAPDPHDRHGTFVVAYDGDEPVGCARGVLLAESFPHEDLLGRYLGAGRIDLPLARIMTVNSVAVLPDWRGRRIVRSRAGGEVTVATRILELLHRRFREAGVLVSLLTTGPRLAETFFRAAGYVALGPPFRLPSYHVPLVDMGAWLADSPLSRNDGESAAGASVRLWLESRGRFSSG